MLVLSRKIGEEIIIDGKVHVRILRASGNRTRWPSTRRTRFLLIVGKSGWPRSKSVSRQALADQQN